MVYLIFYKDGYGIGLEFWSVETGQLVLSNYL